jgi:hypothetical protein
MGAKHIYVTYVEKVLFLKPVVEYIKGIGIRKMFVIFVGMSISARTV